MGSGATVGAMIGQDDRAEGVLVGEMGIGSPHWLTSLARPGADHPPPAPRSTTTVSPRQKRSWHACVPAFPSRISTLSSRSPGIILHRLVSIPDFPIHRSIHHPLSSPMSALRA